MCTVARAWRKANNLWPFFFSFFFTAWFSGYGPASILESSGSGWKSYNGLKRLITLIWHFLFRVLSKWSLLNRKRHTYQRRDGCLITLRCLKPLVDADITIKPCAALNPVTLLPIADNKPQDCVQNSILCTCGQPETPPQRVDVALFVDRRASRNLDRGSTEWDFQQ